MINSLLKNWKVKLLHCKN